MDSVNHSQFSILGSPITYWEHHPKPGHEHSGRATRPEEALNVLASRSKALKSSSRFFWLRAAEYGTLYPVISRGDVEPDQREVAGAQVCWARTEGIDATG